MEYLGIKWKPLEELPEEGYVDIWIYQAMNNYIWSFSSEERLELVSGRYWIERDSSNMKIVQDYITTRSIMYRFLDIEWRESYIQSPKPLHTIWVLTDTSKSIKEWTVDAELPPGISKEQPYYLWHYRDKSIDSKVETHNLKRAFSRNVVVSVDPATGVNKATRAAIIMGNWKVPPDNVKFGYYWNSSVLVRPNEGESIWRYLDCNTMVQEETYSRKNYLDNTEFYWLPNKNDGVLYHEIKAHNIKIMKSQGVFEAEIRKQAELYNVAFLLKENHKTIPDFDVKFWPQEEKQKKQEAMLEVLKKRLSQTPWPYPVKGDPELFSTSLVNKRYLLM